ncbi:MAG: phenylalanine--tRNA ligase subunit beta [Microbacteriaceae bacterium]
MRVPASWLGEFVDLPEDVTAEHLHAALVRVGFEEEEVIGPDIAGPVVVGRVLSAEPEPQSNGKTINWCQVDVGEAVPRGIVCGAHNFAAGDLVVVTLPGAVLPGPFPIAARRTYGHVSDGMIASARELGLGQEHAGILRLAELGIEAPAGADALPLLGLADFAVDVNVTPDRGYALSIRGLAREYALSTGAAFRDPAGLAPLEPASTVFPVCVEDRAPIRGRSGCHGFATRLVRGIDARRRTPAWMVARLGLAGVRSISLPVDVTNYVMLELGQPLHGYDLAALDGGVTGGITVRRAVPGETLETLDGVSRSLDAEDLVIADRSGAIGLAGVMGGARTEMSDATTDVLLEAAGFDPVSIARSARRHRLPSEASRRFERGVDPALAPAALARAARLLVELAGGTIDGTGSEHSTAPLPAPIELAEHRAAALIGVPYTAAEVRGALSAIGAGIEEVPGGLRVTPPSWRPDLVDDADLVEEVARIAGYDRIPAELPVAPPGRGLSREQRLRRQVAAALAAAGLTEVLTHPFASAAQTRLFAGPVAAPVPAMRIENPLDPQAALMRTALVPGLVETAHRNLARGLTELALFEVGRVVRAEAGVEYGVDALPAGDALPEEAVLAGLFAGVPPQPWHVAALFAGDAVPRQPGQAAVPAGIADALDAARVVARAVGLELRFEAAAHQALHPGRSAAVLAGDRLLGHVGELLPELALEANLPRVVGVLELDLDAVIAAAPGLVVARPISGYPAATQDVSLIVAADVPAEAVRQALLAGAGELLESARLSDDYRGAGLPPAAKSLTFALRFRAADRTLTADEATAAKLAGVALAAERLGATLRD